MPAISFYLTFAIIWSHLTGLIGYNPIIMVKFLIFTLGSFIFTFLLSPVIINLLYRFQIREEIRKDGPKTHLKKEGTPTMAGILIVLSVTTLSLIFNLSRSETYLPIFALVLSGAMGVVEDAFKIYRKSFLMKIFQNGTKQTDDYSGKKKNGFLPWYYFKEVFRSLGSKDNSGLKSYQKFLYQAGIGIFLAYWFYFKLDWQTFWFPLVGYVNFSFFYPFFVVFIFTFFVNAVGVSDGLDGLAGGLLTILFGSLGLIALFQNQQGLALFCSTVAGALLAFLYFNFYPARVFMGNVGSHSLGAAAVVVSFLLHKEIVLFVLGTVFTIDLLSVIIQVLSVKIYKKRVFLMAPIHHHFELLGWPETKITMRFWLLGFVFSLLGVLLTLL